MLSDARNLQSNTNKCDTNFLKLIAFFIPSVPTINVGKGKAYLQRQKLTSNDNFILHIFLKIWQIC